MEAKSKTELLQRKTHHERAISWARLNAASVAAGVFFAVMIIIFLLSSRPLRRLDHDLDLHQQLSPSCNGLWLPSLVILCALVRKANVYFAKIVYEQKWLRCSWKKLGRRRVWDDWDHMCCTISSFTNILYLFNIYVLFVIYRICSLGQGNGRGNKGCRSGTMPFSPSSSPCQSRRRSLSHRSHHGHLRVERPLECVRLPSIAPLVRARLDTRHAQQETSKSTIDSP